MIMAKRAIPGEESPHSSAKAVKVETDGGCGEIDSMSEKRALGIVSNLRCDVRDCTLSQEEKVFAIKFAKWALLDREGPKARLEYVRAEMTEKFKCDWTCTVGEENGFVESSSKEPRIQLKLGGVMFLIMKDNTPRDVPVEARRCDMDDDAKEVAIRTIKTAFFLHKKPYDVAKHIARKFNGKYGKYWSCAIYGPGGGWWGTCEADDYILCTRGELSIELTRSSKDEEDEEDEDDDDEN